MKEKTAFRKEKEVIQIINEGKESRHGFRSLVKEGEEGKSGLDH